jgi:hypothetical protein
VGFAFVGSAVTATADGYRGGGGYGGGCCGPVKPTYSTHTVKKHHYIKRYKDVWHKRHVWKVKRHYHVTKIQPIYHIHTVKRVHTKIYVKLKHKNIYSVRHLPPKYIYTGSTVHLKPVCACGGYGGGGYGGGGYGGYKPPSKGY